jgi:hypothetical protein
MTCWSIITESMRRAMCLHWLLTAPRHVVCPQLTSQIMNALFFLAAIANHPGRIHWTYLYFSDFAALQVPGSILSSKVVACVYLLPALGSCHSFGFKAMHVKRVYVQS